jgi:hypothetical protein
MEAARFRPAPGDAIESIRVGVTVGWGRTAVRPVRSPRVWVQATAGETRIQTDRRDPEQGRTAVRPHDGYPRLNWVNRNIHGKTSDETGADVVGEHEAARGEADPGFGSLEHADRDELADRVAECLIE